MKKVMFALCFMFGGIVVVTAQENTQDTTSNQYRTETQSQYPQDGQAQPGQDQQERERIQTTELPDEVKRALEGQEYRGWLISGAFKAKAGETTEMSGQDNTTAPDNTNNDANREQSTNAAGAEGEEIYIVELKNGAETKTIRFDENGEKLEGMDETQNSQFNQEGQTQQGDQYRNDQSTESGQTDPNSTTDPAEQSQSETETRTDESAESESADETAEPQSSQSTQTDQSKANEPE